MFNFANHDPLGLYVLDTCLGVGPKTAIGGPKTSIECGVKAKKKLLRQRDLSFI
jgi:hypothetical protein